MSDFILELRCEEIPAWMQAGARRDLEKLFREHMAATGVTHGAVTVWSTPRRLALIARDLPLATEAVREEIKGPKTSAPPQALEGFLRKTGLSQDRLEDRGGTWFATIEKPGRATAEVLAWAIAAIVRTFPWPKSMRWGAASVSTESIRWVRPLSGIVAVLGEDLVEFEVGGVQSGYATLGHRFHHPGEITIGGAGDYQEKLRACHVIVDHAEREALIRERAAAVAAEAGLALVADEGLVIENAGLTEWPVPLLGRFDPAFLDVPPEVIQLTARTNQKYFVCNDAAGKLANAFVCTANIEASDGGAGIVDGNRKVLAARLADARFFWDQDRRKTIAQHAEKLGNIVFHEKLGTVADKVERVARLARWLVEEGIVKSSPSSLGEGDRSAQPSGGGERREAAAAPPTPPSAASRLPPPRDKLGEDQARLADLAEQAAYLCKADLVTEMVGEFPELQGLMGSYYARAEGLPAEVADAIRDHYKPVGQGDEVPTAPVTVAVSLADKLDMLFAFFAIGELPTGSRDPFALRRSAISAISLLLRNNLRFGFIDSVTVGLPNVGEAMGRLQSAKEAGAIAKLHDIALVPKGGTLPIERGQVEESPRYREMLDTVLEAPQRLVDFMTDRLKVQQREAGVRHDLIDAVFALGGEDDLVRLLARVHALQAFVDTPDGTNLLAGYKRAANILKKEGYHSPAHPERSRGMSHDGAAGPEGVSTSLDMSGEEGLPHYEPETDERALIEALDAAEPLARAAVAAEDFAAAMSALASLRGPIDAFFETVTVNDPDEAKRSARLALLDRFRNAVHQVADFSKIEG